MRYEVARKTQRKSYYGVVIKRYYSLIRIGIIRNFQKQSFVVVNLKLEYKRTYKAKTEKVKTQEVMKTLNIYWIYSYLISILYTEPN